MQSVQRRFGKPRTADESQVAILLKDFEEADKMLSRIIEASKAWRDAWTDIFTVQQRLAYGFQDMYSPIIESNENYEGRGAKETPRPTMLRTVKLQQAYADLKTDLLKEVNLVDTRIIRPAMDAKDHIQPLKKVIKKRADKKMDFEKYQSRVDKGRKNTKRSDKDNAALAKAETELFHATEEYNAADDHLRSRLPPVVTAAFSLLPHLLAAQIMTQNSLLAQCYTVLHEYCGEARFPSPPPAMSEIISSWERDFRPIQKEVETGFAFLSNGKAVRQPMKMADANHGHSISGLNIRNGYAQRRSSSQSSHPRPSAPLAIGAPPEPPSPDPNTMNTRPRISSIPSQTSLSLSTPNYTPSDGPSPSPGDLSSSYAPAGPRADYFSRDRLPSSSSLTSIAAGKKKPPPPPPKRLPLVQREPWVIALYDFAGQGHGDLVFGEGDRIRVLKKTDSTDDWWEGELKGLKQPSLSQAHGPGVPYSPQNDNLIDIKPEAQDVKDAKAPSTSCVICSAKFPNLQEQRRHVRSDWHNYNLKQKLRGHKLVTEPEFDKLVEDLEESLSGSDSSESEDDDDQRESTLTTLLKKQARIEHPEPEGLDDFSPKKRKRGSGKPPLVWFSTPLLPSNTSLGIYRALFTTAEQEQEPDMTTVLRSKQLKPFSSKPSTETSNGEPLPSIMISPHIFLCMVGGGHFAGMIVSLAPKYSKKSTGAEDRQATVIAHKTFHRYTTRRKQGGAQLSNDSAKGAAHSAGASIRRYNEVALESEIRALLTEWRDFIDKSQLIFVRATGSSNRRTLFGPYDGQVLRQNDPRNRGFPFSTRRATQAELMRAFIELTRVKVEEVDEAALAAAAAAESASSSSKPPSAPSKPIPPKPSKEEEEAILHTTQLQALIRRSKVPALLSYLSSNSLPAHFRFHPPTTQANHHAPTPLHLAASINSPAVVLVLLTKAGADPTILNGEGKPAFDLAGDRATRDTFRVARSELGEDQWDWNASHIPSPLTKTEADQRDHREKQEADKAEAERRMIEEQRLKKEEAAKGTDPGKKAGSGRALGAVEKTGAEKREEESRGLTPEMRMKLERERRARAAEARMRGGAGAAGR
ncbi:MAG: hypothetical protein Q9166_002223 [cf. Caloplaca sp. 2 TL-2023]